MSCTGSAESVSRLKREPGGIGGERGYDGGKKVKGRKRYLLLVEDIKGLVFGRKSIRPIF